MQLHTAASIASEGIDRATTTTYQQSMSIQTTRTNFTQIKNTLNKENQLQLKVKSVNQFTAWGYKQTVSAIIKENTVTDVLHKRVQKSI